MNLTDPKALEALLDFDSEDDRIEFNADRIQLDLLGVVIRRMEELGVSKSELAARVGVSKSYVSQLIATDKRPSLKTLARLEDALQGRFSVRFSEAPAEFGSIQDQVDGPDNIIELMGRGSSYKPESFSDADVSGQQQVG